ncbi:MAG: sel1 repeat family protein [Burkholderiales bacterium]|nr:sel1 repeat family protein [Burkholderiales bacterium]
MKTALLIAALLTGFPVAAQEAHPGEDETFSDVRPGEISTDPANLIEGARRGDVRAINNLGLLWARGIGVDAPNFQEAIRWWKEAAKRGYSLSMNNLGLLFANGHGVQQSYEEALKWWEMSAEQGDAWAMNSIGDLYENGHGVTQSHADALDWYERAADGGDGLGMFNLGNFYENGLGVQRDLGRARDWYERSADKGIAVSMHRLGMMTSEGRGVPADPAEGYAWLSVAGRYFGPEDAQDAARNQSAMEGLAGRLTAHQSARAKEIAANLQARIEERRRIRPSGPARPGEHAT